MAKRGAGEGSIFEERTGRWIALVSEWRTTTDGNRKRVRRKFVAKSQAAARKKLKEAIARTDKGLPAADSGETFGAFFESWLKRKTGVKESTRATYRFVAKQYILPTLGRVRLRDLKAEMIDDLMTDLAARGLSGRTQAFVHTLISGVLSGAERKDAVGRNEARRTELRPRVSRPEVKPLTAAEAVRLLQGLVGDRLESLYATAIGTGMRRGELAGLAWDDIDLEAAILNVRRTLSRVGGGVRFTTPKTGGSARTIALPAFVVGSLREHRERQRREREFAGSSWKGCEFDLVWTTSIGTPIFESNLLKHFKGVLQTLGIRHVCFHDLRHTAASLMISAGASLHAVAKVLGHKTIKLTADLYGHLYLDDARKVAEGMDRTLVQIPVATLVATPAVSEKVQ